MISFLLSHMNGQTSGNSQEIEPTELKKKIDNHENIFILDVRTPQEYEVWKLSYENHQNPKLIPADRLFLNDSNLLSEIPKDKEIVTLCAHGNRSMMAARLLNQLGYKVKSVRGGMAGWNKVYDVAEVPVLWKFIQNLADKKNIKGMYGIYCIFKRR